MNSALASDLSGAAAALAGLILVFLGSTATAYDSYDAVQQDTVRARYRRRGGLAFFGFILALISAACAIAGQWLVNGGVVSAAAVFLAISFGLVIVAAYQTYADIS